MKHYNSDLRVIVVFLAFLFIATSLLTACGKRLERHDCEVLLLHYVELLAASDRPDSSSLERLRFKQQARMKAQQDPQFAQCGRTVSRRQFDCAMVATSTDDFERCLM